MVRPPLFFQFPTLSTNWIKFFRSITSVIQIISAVLAISVVFSIFSFLAMFVKMKGSVMVIYPILAILLIFEASVTFENSFFDN